MQEISVQNASIRITGINDNDFISLTDIAKIKNTDDPNSVIVNWLRRVDTLDFLSL